MIKMEMKKENKESVYVRTKLSKQAPRIESEE
jgi:hypothetical protein